MYKHRLELEVDEVVCSYYHSFLFILLLIVLFKGDRSGLCSSKFNCFLTISGEDYVAESEEEGQKETGEETAAEGSGVVEKHRGEMNPSSEPKGE